MSLRTLFPVAVIGVTLAACGGGGGGSGDDAAPPETTLLSGSVGDGPVTSAEVTVRDSQGRTIATGVSDSGARYAIAIPASAVYPLTVVAEGGIDLVTGQAPDVPLESLVVSDRQTIANITPLTTLIRRSLEQAGGSDPAVVAERTRQVVQNIGFGSDVVADPIGSDIEGELVPTVIAASETAGETLRRTRASLQAGGDEADMEQVVTALAADLADGQLDGRGTEAIRSRISAAFRVASAGTLSELLAGRLRVNGGDAVGPMDAAVVAVAPAVSQRTRDMRVTERLIEQTRAAVASAQMAAPSAHLLSFDVQLGQLTPGQSIDAARDRLTVDIGAAVSEAAQALHTLDETALEEVSGVVVGEDEPGTPTNTAPTISGTPPTSIAEETPFRFTPSASDADGDPLVFSVTNRPGWMSFDPVTGTLAGTPDDAQVGSYAAITLSVTDGQETSTLSPFTLVVTAVNDPPVISGNPVDTAFEGTPYSFTPAASDPEGDPLVFAINGKPAWASFDPGTGQLTGTPRQGDAGSQTVAISVSDGQATASLPPFTLTVQEVNAAPVISGTPATAVDERSPYSFQPTVSDIDGDTLTFAIVNRPTWASFDAATGRLSGTPQATDIGTTRGIVISVSDGVASAALPSFDLTVRNVNDAPTIAGSPATTVNERGSYAFTPTAGDPDGDPLTFSVSNRPAWANFDTTTGALWGTPAAADVGSHDGIVISVSDGQLSAELPAFSIRVVDVNDPPVITGVPATEVTENVAYRFVPTASDPEGDVLTFTITNKPTWAQFDPATGTLSGTPGGTDAGVTQGVVIGVSDGQHAAYLPAFDLTVIDDGVVNGTALLSWTPPTARVDGTTLTDLAGYRIHFGRASRDYTETREAGPGVTSYQVEQLEGGDWYFAVTAIDSKGVESDYSNEVSKTISN